MPNHFFARQPIHDREFNVCAYELLFRRDGQSSCADVIDGDQATTEVMIGAMIDVGLTEVAGMLPVYINITGSFMDGSLPLPQNKDQIVLEILEDIEPTPENIATVQRLANEGYRLALDDYQHRPELEPLLHCVEIVKIDVQALTRAELEAHVALLKPYGVTLLAEKVETRAEFEHCLELQFDSFQGYFFCEPEHINTVRPSTNRAIAMQLMAKLLDANCNFDEVETLISNDPTLSLRLLRYINSPFCGMVTKINSVRHALTMVGTELIRGWASLLLMSKLAEGKPQELITTALIRAKACETLGRSNSECHESEFFTVGIFSVVDALVGSSLESALSSLPLSDRVNIALTKRQGALGQTLTKVLDHEQNPLAHADSATAQAYLHAVVWSQDLAKNL